MSDINQVLDDWSYVFILSAAGVYVGAFIAFVLDMAARAGAKRRSRARSASVASGLMWLSLALHLGGVILRGLSTGVVPWATMYEFTITATLLIGVVYQIVALTANLRYLGVFVTGFIVLALAVATIFFWRPSTTLNVSLDSYWLLIHVVVAMLGTAFFALGAGASGMQLWKAHHLRRAEAAHETAGEHGDDELGTAEGGFSAAAEGAVTTMAAKNQRAASIPRTRADRFLASLPSVDDLEAMSYRVTMIGFVFWTFTLIFGALWAQKAWGRYWGWDVKEVWTFVIWTIYAGYLHARATRGWRGDRAAWLAIIGFLAVLFNFTVVNIYFKGWHAYSGL